jgi:hypothetical protein
LPVLTAGNHSVMRREVVQDYRPALRHRMLVSRLRRQLARLSIGARRKAFQIEAAAAHGLSARRR